MTSEAHVGTLGSAPRLAAACVLAAVAGAGCSSGSVTMTMPPDSSVGPTDAMAGVDASAPDATAATDAPPGTDAATDAGADAGLATCDFYASPTGGGDGGSDASPFQIADFWDVAVPGRTLCLLDGVYRGDRSMIRPPADYDTGARSCRRTSGGADGRPVTVRALHDGGAVIDGEDARTPVYLLCASWIVIEGVDAHDAGPRWSSGSVFAVAAGSEHDVLRRVVGWDANDANTNVFGLRGAHNLLEDCGAFGISRKQISASQSGDSYNTVRRCWARWEGSHVVGPKMAVTLAYNNRYMLVENLVATWSGERMQESYTLMGYDGTPWLGYGGTPTRHTGYQIDQPYGIVGIDRLDDDRHAHIRLLGSLLYLLPGARVQPPRGLLITSLEDVELRDVFVHTAGGGQPPMTLSTVSGGGASGLLATDVTAIGTGDTIHGDWTVDNLLEAPSVADAYASGQSAFNTTRGANLCHRYVDGERTTEPLWPWPMNRRIIDAMVRAGYAPVDVTATVESLLGEIPPECRR